MGSCAEARLPLNPHPDRQACITTGTGHTSCMGTSGSSISNSSSSNSCKFGRAPKPTDLLRSRRLRLRQPLRRPQNGTSDPPSAAYGPAPGNADRSAAPLHGPPVQPHGGRPPLALGRISPCACQCTRSAVGWASSSGWPLLAAAQSGSAAHRPLGWHRPGQKPVCPSGRHSMPFWGSVHDRSVKECRENTGMSAHSTTTPTPRSRPLILASTSRYRRELLSRPGRAV
jgi:hypothetical protein